MSDGWIEREGPTSSFPDFKSGISGTELSWLCKVHACLYYFIYEDVTRAGGYSGSVRRTDRKR